MTPLERLRYNVTGAIERGEANAIVEQTLMNDIDTATPLAPPVRRFDLLESISPRNRLTYYRDGKSVTKAQYIRTKDHATRLECMSLTIKKGVKRLRCTAVYADL